MKKYYVLTIALLISAISFAQLSTKYVGTGSGGYTASSADKLSTNIEQPWGSALDSKGNVWITTEGGHEIKMLQLSTAKVYIRSGAYGLASFVNAAGVTARFYNPRGVAVGPGDTIFIADFNNCAIRKMTPFLSIGSAQTVSVLAGKYTGSSTLTSYPGYANGSANVAQFDGPSDVVVDANGNVYVADYNNNAIRKVTRAGVVTTLTGQGPTTSGSTDGTLAQATFNHPTGLCMDGDTLYVADNGNGKIRKIAISGNSVSTVVSGLYSPTDVIINNRVLYITDQHRIRKYANGTLSTFCGSSTINDFGHKDYYGTNARFYNLKGIFYNTSDNFIWVADQDNHYIKRVSICPASSAPTVTLTGNDTFCVGGSATLTAPAGFAKYKWSTKDSTQSIIVKSSGSYTVTVQGSDSCASTSVPIVITVVNPVATITYTTPLTFCLGDSVILKGPAGYTSYLWSNNATTKDITVKTSGTYSLIVGTYTCTDTSTPVTVTVKTTPTSNFTLSKSSVCVNDTIKVTFTGTAGSGATYTWSWNSGIVVSGTGQGPYVIKWTASGPKQITLQVSENGCTSSLTQMNITVNSLPTSAFTSSKTAVCPSTNITFTFTGTGSPTTFNWNFDNGMIASGSGQGPYDVYWTSSGSKTVGLTVSDANGCSSALTTKAITINSTPSAQLSATKTSVDVYVLDTIYHSGKKANDTFTWDFSNPDQFVQIVKDSAYKVAWFTSGTKTITLTVQNKCTSTNTLQITVNQPGSKPVASFSGTPTTINQGQSVSFTDLSANTPTSWKWTFTGGTPATSTQKNPSITYNTAGIYSVKLVVTNAYGSDSLTKNTYITVNASPKPVADFSGTPTTVTEGGTVNFTDQSTNTPTSWLWTFTGGTPATSTVQNPSVVYSTAGTYTVKLEATNSYGTGIISKNAYITVNPPGQLPVAAFTSNFTSIKAGQTVTFTDQSTNAIGVAWTFTGGNPSTSNISSPAVTYNTVGNYDVKLVAINANGTDTLIKTNYIKVTVGIDDEAQKAFRIYPSPVKDKLFIESVAGVNIRSIEVVDITGKARYETKYSVQGNEIVLDLSILPKGLYILKITGKELNYSSKFSKE